MTKKHYSLKIRGKSHTYTFDVWVDPRHLERWWADGIEIDEVVNTIPQWAVNVGLMRPWIFVQDLFNFRNPFA